MLSDSASSLELSLLLLSGSARLAFAAEGGSKVTKGLALMAFIEALSSPPLNLPELLSLLFSLLLEEMLLISSRSMLGIDTYCG